MAYTQQLINKEDHLLACTTRMFETQPLLVKISKCARFPTESDDLDVKAAYREKSTLTHILAVSDYSLVKEPEANNLSAFAPKSCSGNNFRRSRHLFPQTLCRSGRGDTTETFLRVKLCFLFCSDLVNPSDFTFNQTGDDSTTERVNSRSGQLPRFNARRLDGCQTPVDENTRVA